MHDNKNRNKNENEKMKMNKKDSVNICKAGLPLAKIPTI